MVVSIPWLKYLRKWVHFLEPWSILTKAQRSNTKSAVACGIPAPTEDETSGSSWDHRPGWIPPHEVTQPGSHQLKTIQLIQHTGDHNCQENSLLELSSFKCVFSRNTLRNPFKSQGISAHSQTSVQAQYQDVTFVSFFCLACIQLQ